MNENSIRIDDQKAIRVDAISVILLTCSTGDLDRTTARLIHTALIRLGVTEEEFETALTQVTTDIMLMALNHE